MNNKCMNDHIYTIMPYQQVECSPGCSLARHAPGSQPRSQLRSRPGKSNKLTKILLKPHIESASMKSNGWSPMRTSNQDYLVKQHLQINATTGCEIYSTEHGEALHRAQTALARLNMVSITIFREAYVLDVNTWEVNTPNWLILLIPAAEAPIDAEWRAEALFHPHDSENDLHRDLQTTGMDGWWSMSLKVVVRRIWKWFRRFLLFLCFFLFSSLFISSLDLGLVQMASAQVFTTCLWRWSFHVRWIRRKVTIELYWSVVGLMGLYYCVCWTVVWLLTFIPFHSFLLYWLWHPRRSSPNEEDNITATRDPRPGKRQCI